MKIVEQSQTQLTLRKGPIGIVSIIGSFIVLMGPVIASIGYLTTFNCNRIEPSQGGCQLVTSSLWEADKKTVLLNQLEGAKVETKSSDDGDTYEVLILINKPQQALTIYSSADLNQAEVIVSRINNFVKNPVQKSLIVEQDKQFYAFIVGGLLAAFGFVLVLMEASIIICTLDKTLGNFILKRQDLFGTKFIQHQLQEIKDVELEFNDDDNSRIAVVLVSGERVPFTDLYIDYGNNEKTVQCIREFLNL